MTRQYLFGATLVVVSFGVLAVEPVYAQQRRDGNLLPQEQGGQVVAVGCLLHGSDVRGGKKDKDKYVLARPRKGPVASVPEASCTADAGAAALDLDNTKDAGVTDSLVGRWVEIGGRLEKETDKNPDNLRELDVKTYKLVPVVIPRAAAAPANTPARTASAASRSSSATLPGQSTPQATGSPAAVTAQSQEAGQTLPHTATNRPAIALARAALPRGRPASSFVPCSPTSLNAADTDRSVSPQRAGDNTTENTELTETFSSVFSVIFVVTAATSFLKAP